MKLLLCAAASAFALAGAAQAQTATPATPATPATAATPAVPATPATPATAASYTDQQLRNFAAATIRISELQAEQKASGQTFTTEEEAARMKTELAPFGFDSGTAYNEMAQVLARDPAVVTRVQGYIAQRSQELAQAKADAAARAQAEAQAAAQAQAAQAQAQAQAPAQAQGEGQTRMASAQVNEDRSAEEGAPAEKKRFRRTIAPAHEGLRARMRAGQGRR